MPKCKSRVNERVEDLNIEEEIKIKEEILESYEENEYEESSFVTEEVIVKEEAVKIEKLPSALYRLDNEGEKENAREERDTGVMDVLVNGSSEILKVNVVDELRTEIEQSPSGITNLRKRKTFVPLKAIRKQSKSINGKGSFSNKTFASMRDIGTKASQMPRQDEYTLYGEQIALKLKKFDEITRTETEHKINCIMYEAEMKVLRQRAALRASYHPY